MSNLYKLLQFLLSFSRSIPYSRFLFGLIIFLGVAGGLANVGLVALINDRLHDLSQPKPFLMAFFVALLVLLPLARFLSSAVLTKLTQRTLLFVRMELAERILQAPLRQLESHGRHRLLAALTDDVGAISSALAGVPLLFMHGAVLVGCLVYLGWLSWPGLLVVLVFMVVGIATYQLPLSKAMEQFRLARKKWDGVFKGLRALTEGTKELKLHRRRREVFFEDHLKASALAMQDHTLWANLLTAGAQSWGQILFFVLIGLVLFVLPNFGSSEEYAVTGFCLTILYMMSPIEVVLNLVPSFGRARVAVNTINELGLSLDAEKADTTIVGGSPAWQNLELRGATYTYFHRESKETFTLGPIGLDLQPGELLFVIGGNGSGKTTLVKLLTGLYVPEEGELRWDGAPVDGANRESYRQLFSVVFTDFFLFGGFFGIDHPELDRKARDYLELLELSEKVEVKEGVLSTLALSQGQRKRLALLTAYLEDRPIYVFDEWAADQDPQFKKFFYYKLLPDLRAEGKTVIVISHDDHYYGAADRLVKLDYGQVEFDGTVASYFGSQGPEPLFSRGTGK